jgi:hypothetical protein
MPDKGDNTVTMKPYPHLFLHGLAVVCFLLPAMTGTTWAFKYTQDISVGQSGLTRCYLPKETTENYGVREELRLFSPDGQEVPYLFEYPDVERIGLEENIPRTSLKTQFLENKTVVEFSAPSSLSVSGFNVYTGVSDKKKMRIERCVDGQIWDTLVPDIEAGSSARFNVVSPTPGTTFRVTLDDSLTPPSSGIQVQWVRASSPVQTLAMEIPFKKTRTSEFGERFELSAPRRNVYVNTVSVFVADMANVDLNNVRATTVYLPTQREGRVEKHITAIVRLVSPGKGQSPYLAVSMGVAADDYRSVLYLMSHNGSPLRVVRMEALVMPLSILFQANQAGNYKLRFGIDGPATDPVLIYGREPMESLSQRRKEKGIRLATAGAIQTHATYAKAMESPLWDPLPSSFDPQPFHYRTALRVLRSGFQAAQVPAEIFGVSSSEGDDWRLTTNGREIPFLIRRHNGQTPIKSRFEKMSPAGDKPRWVLEGTFDNVPSINIRFDVKGLFKPTRARLISSEGIGEKILLEFPWEFDEHRYRRFLSESGQRVPLTREQWPTVLYIGSNGVPVKGRRLILEVDDPSFDLPEPKVTGGTHKIIFKASPGDEILFYCGLDKPSPPDYPLRKDPKIPLTVADQTAHFVPESFLGNSQSHSTGGGLTVPEAPIEEGDPPEGPPSIKTDHGHSRRSVEKRNSLGVSLFVVFSLLGIGYIFLKK